MPDLTLQRQENGRYLLGERELTGGAVIEVHDGNKWVRIRVEFIYATDAYLGKLIDAQGHLELMSGMPARLVDKPSERLLGGG